MALLLWLAWMIAALWLGRWPRPHGGSVWFALGAGLGAVGMPLIFQQLLKYLFDVPPMLVPVLLFTAFAMALAVVPALIYGPRPVPRTALAAASLLALPFLLVFGVWVTTFPAWLQESRESRARAVAQADAEAGRDTRANWIRAVGAPPLPATALGVPQREASPQFPRLMPFSAGRGSYNMDRRLSSLSPTLCAEIPAAVAPNQAEGWLEARIRPLYALGVSGSTIRAPLRWKEMWTEPPGPLPPVACADLEVPQAELRGWPTAPTDGEVTNMRADGVKLEIGAKVWMFQGPVQSSN